MALGRARSALEPGQSFGGLVAPRDDLSERVAVLAAQILQHLASIADRRETRRIGVDPLAGAAQRASQIVHLGGELAQSTDLLGERGPVPEGTERTGEGVGRTAIVGQRGDGTERGVAMSGGIGQQFGLGAEMVVLLSLIHI